MFKEHVDKMEERWIMKHSSLFQDALEEGFVIIVYHLTDDRKRRILGLQNHESPLALSSGSSAHLRHHHEGMLVGSEVWIVQHRVGIQNTHNPHFVKVETFGYHLRTYQKIGLSR